MSDVVRCAVCGVRIAVHKHHRKRRGEGDDRPINLLDVCFVCHEWIHKHPEEAHEMGLIVWTWEEPEDVPVKVSLERLQNESAQLTVDGDEVPHKHVVNADGTEEECPRCHGKGRVLKKTKPLAGEETGPKQKTVWGIRVPKENRENGAEILDGLVNLAADKLAEGGHEKGWGYRTVVMALSWFNLNYIPAEDDN